MAHGTKIKVRGYHIDLYKHVNNARYLEFLEEARWAMLDDLVDREKWHSDGFGLSVVNINIDYRQTAKMGDCLEIYSNLNRIGNKSVVIEQKIVLSGGVKIVVEALVTFVVVDEKTGRAIPITDKIKSRLMLLNQA